ncbi:MAG: hypothetical protein K9N55_05975 [Phycisphaerae bacterium]|nr:hypothetical protein [Phycisphaerae bacterium]
MNRSRSTHCILLILWMCASVQAVDPVSIRVDLIRAINPMTPVWAWVGYDECNYKTGRIGSPLDFIGFHAKGSPRFVDGRVQMNLGAQMRDIAKGFKVVASFDKLKDVPIVIGESDPEDCAACSEALHPDNAYHNGTLYSSSYTADQIKALEQAGQLEMLTSPAYVKPIDGKVTVPMDLPRQAVSLLKLVW